jgi:FkbM family methyltransferase
MDADPVDCECIVQEVYEALLRDGDIAIDVGAHVGRHSFPMARCVHPTGKVFAFEPLPMCRQVLDEQLAGAHAELAGVLTVFPQALADHAGDRPFVIAEDALPFSGLHEGVYPGPTAVRRITVAVETLDRVFLDLPALRYMKIDAEGAELAILRGAESLLERLRPVVGFELGMSANQQLGSTPANMARFWEKHSYNVYGIHGRRLTESDIVESARRHEIWDYVAVPREDTVADKAVRQTLRRPRVNWLVVNDTLQQARRHAAVGSEVPPLRRFRGPLHGLARTAARLVLFLARIVTRPQQEVNLALVHCLGRLAADLEKTEKEQHWRDSRLRALEEQVRRLEQSLARLGEVHRQTLDLLEERLADPERARVGE